jgi:Zn-dependent protease with chaperone function
MTNEQYEALVRRLETYAAGNRAAYVTRVALLALLGYGYVLLILIAVIGSIAGLTWIAAHGRTGYAVIGKVIIALGLLGFVILRALWVRFPPPSGIRLRRHDTPALFDLVKTLTARLKTPRFHRVLVTDDFNAAVSQNPRLGPFGWYRNYLLLGLPLMQALSPEEFRAVLAHELGHLSRQHGRFGSWIYRIRMMWVRLVHQLEAQQHWGHALFDWFLKRWAPYFNAYSFVLARTHEYEADRFAADLAGKDHLARALAKLEVMGTYLQRQYWPSVFGKADAEPQPPAGVLGSLAVALRAGPAAPDERRWLSDALSRKTGHDDTHPSLSDRLAALGVRASAALERGAAAGQPNAAEHYFGDTLPRVVRAVEQSWTAAVHAAWQERNRFATQARQRLAELDGRATSHPLTVGQAWERIRLTLDLDGEEAALPRLRELVEQAPDHAAASYTLGRLLLDRDDPSGVPHIERAVEREPGARPDGYLTISRFYERQGRERDADDYRRRAWAQGDLMELAGAERKDVTANDRLVPHELSPEQVREVRAQLERIPEVKVAYVVRKEVQHLPEQPFFVVGVELRLAWYKFQSTSKEQQIVERVAEAVPLPGQLLVLALNSHRAKIRRKLKRVPGAELLRR